MKIEILMNLGDEWGTDHWQNGEIHNAPDDVAEKLIAKGLARPTDKAVTKKLNQEHKEQAMAKAAEPTPPAFDHDPHKGKAAEKK